MRLPSIALALFLIGSVGVHVEVKRELRERLARSSIRATLNTPAPALALPDLHGNTVDLHMVAGKNKLVLLNFWATWCAPCRMEMSQFEKIYKKKKSEGFEILAVNVEEEAGTVRNYLARTHLSFPILLDVDGKAGESYGVRAFPTSVLIDSKGKVIQVFEGMNDYLEFQIDHHLKEAAKDD